mgnify:CR=1 FL=1
MPCKENMKCREECCDGLVNISFKVTTGCLLFEALDARACNKCGKLYWLNGHSVFSQIKGVRQNCFLEDGKIVLKDN